MYDLESIWSEVLEIIKPDISPVGFDTWIKSITPFRMEDNEIILEVPNKIYKEMIESRYIPLIKTALTYISDTDYEITIIEQEEREALSSHIPSVKINNSKSSDL